MSGNISSKRFSVSASTLKTIALVTMFIDHLGAVFISELERGYLSAGGMEGFITPYLRMIGRIAFILYAFLLVEGFVNTSDRGKYMKRLLAGAVISEIPFDLATAGMSFYPWDQNIFFTLLIGFGTIWILDGLRSGRNEGKDDEKPDTVPILPGSHFGSILCEITVVVGGMLLAELIRCDYGCMGVGLIVVFYLFRWNGKLFWAVLAESYFGLILSDLIHYFVTLFRYYVRTGMPFKMPDGSTVLLNLINWAANRMVRSMPGIIAAMLLILSYSGEKGKQLPKAFYYLFYPVHLFWLYLAVRLIS
ncbi:MAG: conjugal transfer protein TraX [Lachnospiraceae bacterium]|nr:conjugal transfer protein TraX [Lachnospiraceae bacterium]